MLYTDLSARTVAGQKNQSRQRSVSASPPSISVHRIDVDTEINFVTNLIHVHIARLPAGDTSLLQYMWLWIYLLYLDRKVD